MSYRSDEDQAVIAMGCGFLCYALLILGLMAGALCLVAGAGVWVWKNILL
jgi:hypothetical protein